MEIVLLEGCVLMSFCLRDKDDSSTSKFQSRGLIYQELDSCETPLVGAVISFSCFFFFSLITRCEAPRGQISTGSGAPGAGAAYPQTYWCNRIHSGQALTLYPTWV